ncbi:hypothetical protein A0H81_02771 [Grifola frondosa]|uniref:Uncharacterized protein n=1 Tax=Grifola frondosa TaxID=5627 RepID=A0A1C7MT77_GRIFR|nr:hypothetical protein A0H81_02771 [Grifola frondosa]
MPSLSDILTHNTPVKVDPQVCYKQTLEDHELASSIQLKANSMLDIDNYKPNFLQRNTFNITKPEQGESIDAYAAYRM